MTCLRRAGHNKYAAVHRGTDLGQRTTERRHDRDSGDRIERVERRRDHEQRERDHSRERNPYREAESLPYIQSMEKMMKSTGMRYGEANPKTRDRERERERERDFREPPPAQNSQRDRFHDAKDKFRAMEQRPAVQRYPDIDERDTPHRDHRDPYRSSSRRRRASVEPPSTYEQWSEEEESPPPVVVVNEKPSQQRDLNRSRARSRGEWEPEPAHPAPRHLERSVRDRERERDRDRDYNREQSRDPYRHERERERPGGRAHSREYLQSVETKNPSTTGSGRGHLERYPSPAATPSRSGDVGGGGGGGSSGGNSGKPLAQMPKGYRHSYAEPVFARNGGRVGLAAVNPY